MLAMHTHSNPHHVGNPKLTHQQDRPSGTKEHGEPCGFPFGVPPDRGIVASEADSIVLSVHSLDVRKQNHCTWATESPAEEPFQGQGYPVTQDFTESHALPGPGDTVVKDPSSCS